MRNHQLAHLSKEYRKSMDNTLRPYKDSDSIWRSKGRLGNAAIENDAKNPIIIAPKTTLAQHLIREAHGDFHKGIEHTIATVRETYWIPRLRQQARSLISQCVKCPLSAPSDLITNACQYANVLEHHDTICTMQGEVESCSVTISEVLKLSTFRQEACLHLIRNSTLIANIKVRWKGLYLRCEQESEYFTRSTTLSVIHSKRCPHMGSCSGDKCAAINGSSLIPELENGNKYPGRTGCIESCGGLGCDCFYLSSGCLFYRVFAKPKSSKIYEIFRCMRWTEDVKLSITVENIHTESGLRKYVTSLIPNVPKELPSLQVTITSLTLPPTPKLNSEFISDGIETALWTRTLKPNLRCNSLVAASKLNCTFFDDCKCAPAEYKNMAEIESLRQQLRQTRRNLRQLQRAIPPLPEPQQLYDKIVSQCFDHYTCTQAVSSLEETVRRLRLPTKPFRERLHEIELSDLQIDRLRLKFLFCRAQLRTLYAIPPLLIATQQMSSEFWATLMSQPQEISEGKPLLMDLQLIEEIVTDHLQMLGTLHSTLNDLHTELQNEKDREILGFEKEMRAKLDQLHQLTMDSRNSIIRELQAINTTPDDRFQGKHHARGEGIPGIQNESDVIEDNASYMEGVEIGEEDDGAAEPGDLDDHNPVLEAALDPAPDLPEAGEENRDANAHAAPDAAFGVPEDIENAADVAPQAAQVEEDEEIARIEEDLRNAEQALRNFGDILIQLEAEPVCPPRRFYHGNIHKAVERHMRCAFCDAVGTHYSDSCMVVSDAISRRVLVKEKNKCELCLERICARGLTCKKYRVLCFHCRNTGHHSALCYLPERSEIIRRQLKNAQEGREAAINRVEQLRRELASRRDAQ
ncbi:unnamed protein product [Heligmosomoides polygyrus]|uniref:Integrase zinc-binding domain-containing protein n=1 Tax=Heligmosomoides polygyrus TaxID=6339 RepID=A0A3P8DH34_HELPZ|nr:unnamed protein product [Heligmosomoides polygyrus]